MLKKGPCSRGRKQQFFSTGMVSYLNLRPSHSVENSFSDWQQLGAAVLLLHAIALSTQSKAFQRDKKRKARAEAWEKANSEVAAKAKALFKQVLGSS